MAFDLLLAPGTARIGEILPVGVRAVDCASPHDRLAQREVLFPMPTDAALAIRRDIGRDDGGPTTSSDRVIAARQQPSRQNVPDGVVG